MQPLQYRQGDVFIEQVSAIPAGAVPVARDKGRVILAYGEVTGHAHVVQTDAEAVEALLASLNDDLYLTIPNGGRVVHDEHNTITLPPGAYKVTRQRQYTPERIIPVGD